MWPTTVLVAALLLAPVFDFVRHHGYAPLGLTLPVVAIVGFAAVAGAAATARRPILRAALVAAVITLFVDLAFNIDVPVPGIGPNKLFGAIFLFTFGLVWAGPETSTRIGAAMAATMVVASLVLPYRPVIVDQGQRRKEGMPAPLLVHIVLDEHMGVEGLQAAAGTTGTGRFVRTALEAAGFRVFGAVYAQDLASEFSLGRVLNFQVDNRPNDAVRFTTDFHETELTRNLYFDRLVARGFSLSVLQTSFVNLCPDSLPAFCRSYDVWKLGNEAFAALPFSRRLDIMNRLFWRRSELWQLSRRLIGLANGPADAAPMFLSPLSGMAILDDLASRLGAAKPGDAYLAHVPLPHYPYVYDASCGVRPVRDWLDRDDLSVPPGWINTSAGRRLRYALYGEQVRCLFDKLRETLQAIPEHLAQDAIVLVHGDHGSRITERDPKPGVATDADYIDAYATLFAVRAPALAAGYQSDQVSLACLFRALIDVQFRVAPAVSECGPSDAVFVKHFNAPVRAGVMPRMDGAF